ncbi:hypothetical protein NDU88_005372, partial [Pleurodeles waltl]
KSVGDSICELLWSKITQAKNACCWVPRYGPRLLFVITASFVNGKVPPGRHHPSYLSKRPVVYINSCSEAMSNQHTV